MCIAGVRVPTHQWRENVVFTRIIRICTHIGNFQTLFLCVLCALVWNLEKQENIHTSVKFEM